MARRKRNYARAQELARRDMRLLATLVTEDRLEELEESKQPLPSTAEFQTLYQELWGAGNETSFELEQNGRRPICHCSNSPYPTTGGAKAVSILKSRYGCRHRWNWQKGNPKRSSRHPDFSLQPLSSHRVQSSRLEEKSHDLHSEGWQRPQPGGQLETNYRRLSQNARELLKELVERIKVKEIGGGGSPLMAKPVGAAEVLIVPRDREQMVKIREKVRGMRRMEVRESRRGSLFMMVSGVDADMTEVRECLMRRVGGGSREGREENGMRCRNVWRENVVVRVGVNEFRELMNKEKVEMGRSVCFVEEYVDILMCFRCCEFGHVIRCCKRSERCYVCSGEHDGRLCKREFLGTCHIDRWVTSGGDRSGERLGSAKEAGGSGLEEFGPPVKLTGGDSR